MNNNIVKRISRKKDHDDEEWQREMFLLLPYVENILNAACESDVTISVTATSITSSIHA
jgi:hypothetical protein